MTARSDKDRKHLTNVETRCCCPQSFLSLEFQSTDDVSELKSDIEGLEKSAKTHNIAGKLTAKTGPPIRSYSGVYVTLTQTEDTHLTYECLVEWMTD